MRLGADREKKELRTRDRAEGVQRYDGQTDRAYADVERAEKYCSQVM